MMEFHLNYSPAPSTIKISHRDTILTIGSCFAVELHARLSQAKFECACNPNGILFNPMSISKALNSYLNKTLIKSDELILNDGIYCSLNHQYAELDEKDVLTESINSNTENYHDYLKSVKFLIITFGSAFVYRHIKTNQIVANCHKLPQQEFKKELLSVENIVAEYKLLFEKLKTINPNLNIILTVSPVKYLRDGIVENNLSKSILIQSIHQLLTLNSQPSTLNSQYFPAYELVNDDLRDYRFYKEDMAHPNDQAIDYVWKKFSDVYFTAETKNLNEKIKEINLAVSHRPLNENSPKHKEFKAAAYKKCTDLETNYPFLNFVHEKRVFS